MDDADTLAMGPMQPNIATVARVIDGEKTGELETVIISIKAGHVNVRPESDRARKGGNRSSSVHALTDKANEVGGGDGRFYESVRRDKKYQMIHLLTLENFFSRKLIEMPSIRRVGATYMKAAKHEKPVMGMKRGLI